MKFTKKPVIIDAIQWFPGIEIEGVTECDMRIGYEVRLHLYPTTEYVQYEGPCGVIKTLEGNMFAMPGDWIITGIKGEKYPCKPDIFTETYDLVKEEIL